MRPDLQFHLNALESPIAPPTKTHLLLLACLMWLLRWNTELEILKWNELPVIFRESDVGFRIIASPKWILCFAYTLESAPNFGGGFRHPGKMSSNCNHYHLASISGRPSTTSELLLLPIEILSFLLISWLGLNSKRMPPISVVDPTLLESSSGVYPAVMALWAVLKSFSETHRIHFVGIGTYLQSNQNQLCNLARIRQYRQVIGKKIHKSIGSLLCSCSRPNSPSSSISNHWDSSVFEMH